MIRETGKARFIRERAALWRIKDDETGAFTLMSLFIIAIMLACFGFAIDYMRAEAARARLQGTLDQAILAAASKYGSTDPDTGLPRTAEEVARSYFEAAGLDPNVAQFSSSGDCNDTFVQANARMDIKTTYLGVDYVGDGHDSFPAPASGRASETMPRIEVSLVLDVSGSMGSNKRIENLRPAAKEFVSMMLETPCTKPNVYVSIVPFATQVSIGGDLQAAFNVSDEHDSSQCVDFDGAAFGSLSVSPTLPLRRTAHFDPWMGPGNSPAVMTDPAYKTAHDPYWVCHPDASRDIIPWSIDETALETFIDNMPVGGNTSMDVGAKWGLALLDPVMRPVLSDYVAAGDVDGYYAGRPLDYSGNPSDVIKVLVLMTDGQHTDQYYLKNGYRSGGSGIWVDAAANGERKYSTYMGHFYVDDSDWTPGDGWDRSEYGYNELELWTPDNDDDIEREDAFPVFFHHNRTSTIGDRNAWRPSPHGADWRYDFDGSRHSAGGSALDRIVGHSVAELSWPELFATTHVQYWSDKLHYEAQVAREHPGGAWTGRWDGWYDAVGWVNPSTKDSRLHSVCKEARNKGVHVFTISFEAPQAGRTALLNCANDGAATSRYFDVEGKGIRDAFASIVEQLNLLRLTK